MIDHVDRTLQLWRSTPFTWGSRDCMLSIGDYIASRGGVDVTGLFRGTYDGEAGALAYVASYGGCVGLIDLTGLPHVADPKRGDVVVFFTGETEVGALCTGEGIAMRLERGVIELPKRLVSRSRAIVQAWSVP